VSEKKSRPNRPRSQWVRDKMRAFMVANPTCHLCGKPVKLDASRYDPERGQVDHLIPYSKRPDLHNDPTNWATAHARCNNQRNNRDLGSFGSFGSVGRGATSGGGLVRCPGDGLAVVSVRELEKLRGTRAFNLPGDNRCDACRATYPWSRTWHSEPCR